MSRERLKMQGFEFECSAEPIHVYPTGDEKPHDTSSRGQCWCKPRLNYVNPDTGCELWVHNLRGCENELPV